MKRLKIHPQLTQRARQFRRPMTPMERRLWASLRDRKCSGYKFRRQVVLDRFIADFYCAEARLLIEVDGASHDATMERDEARDEWLAAHGYQTLRVTNAEVRDNLEGILTLIANTCEEFTTREIVPSPPTPLPDSLSGASVAP
jgi:very-short-patch-repair endonuclease